MNNPSCRLFKYVAHTYGNIGKVRGGAVSTMRHVSFTCHGRQYERVKRVTGKPTLERPHQCLEEPRSRNDEP